MRSVISLISSCGETNSLIRVNSPADSNLEMNCNRGLIVICCAFFHAKDAKIFAKTAKTKLLHPTFCVLCVFYFCVLCVNQKSLNIRYSPEGVMLNEHPHCGATRYQSGKIFLESSQATGN